MQWRIIKLRLKRKYKQLKLALYATFKWIERKFNSYTLWIMLIKYYFNIRKKIVVQFNFVEEQWNYYEYSLII